MAVPGVELGADAVGEVLHLGGRASFGERVTDDTELRNRALGVGAKRNNGGGDVLGDYLLRFIADRAPRRPGPLPLPPVRG